MSSQIDPAKLKVVELRAELSKRGLDTKGVKVALVKRLKEALEEELAEELPDTSIADTSTEDLDTSQNLDEEKPAEKVDEPENEVASQDSQPSAPSPTPPLSEPAAEAAVTDDKPMEVDESKEEAVDEDKPQTVPEKSAAEEEKTKEEVVEPPAEAATAEEKIENGDQDEPKAKRSRWGTEEVDKSEEVEKDTTAPSNDSEQSVVESKGEKRRRSSQSSPERAPKVRNKTTPIKEDEPPIDNDKVQLSWYDSDLHLQVDKESFLSAKPFHEGAFGFAWAGVRTTHGVNTGKVFYECKITEQLKWEDFAKHNESSRNRRESTKREQQKETTTNKEDDKDEIKNGNKEEEETKEGDEEKKQEETDREKDNEDQELSKEPEQEKSEEKEEQEKSGEKEDQEKIEEKEDGEKSEEKEDGEKSEEKRDEEKEKSCEKEVSEPLPTHLFRIGWSLPKTSLQLGEEKFSYGYESSGEFVTDKQFRDYGIPYSVGDVIATYLEISDETICIRYTVNGVLEGDAITVDKSELPSEDFALFPHVLTRNYAFELNLGSKENWFPKPEECEDYEYLDKVDNKVVGRLRPETRSECEVILMCGLPSSGKTYWVREYVEANPDKNFTLLGDSHLLDKMTISGEAFRGKYKGNWDSVYDKIQKAVTKLVDVASYRRRNFIIDQTNVFPSAQRRKLRLFEGFKRRAAVVVVVGDEEQAKRQSLQREAQGGNDVSDNTVLDFKASMVLPEQCDYIDEVIYAGVDENEAKTIVEKYNSEGKEAGYGEKKRTPYRSDHHHHHDYHHRRWQNRRNDYRGGQYRDNRNYQQPHHRYDQRGQQGRQGNWHNNRSGGGGSGGSGGGGGGGWNRDRRDSRPPPRDWRNNRVIVGGRDRPPNNRDSHNQGNNSYNNNNRNRNQQRSNSSTGNWQSSGQQQQWANSQWGGNQGWSGGGGQSTWSGQQQQNHWKYGGGAQSYGSYGANWNYYGQYAQQNWPQHQQQQQSQTQSQTTSAAVTSTQGQQQIASNTNQYGQYSQQQQAWAQYAQQYAQVGQQQQQQNTSLTPSSTQK